MNLDAKGCYRALRSRDRRFDGRFFTGVTTTGVYCRPVCPAPLPKPGNCRFFASAAAAEAAGFRACLRCKPEHSAGTPAWPFGSQTVARALRLIGDGALDEAGVDALAARVGVGGRQLRRLFDEHLGAGPLAVARQRRAHFAKRLLDDTALPVTQVAFAAGYRSVRQFNHDFRATFRCAPSEVRRRRVAGSGEALTLRLAYRPPLDWAGLVAFLAARATRGVEAVDGTVYRRTIGVAGSPGMISIAPVPGEHALVLSLVVPPNVPVLPLVERARAIADLGADPMAIADGLSQDALIGPMIAARPGVRVPGSWDGFEVAVRAVLGQQISVRAATTIAGRLAERFGKPVETDLGAGLTHLFPSPEALVDAGVETVGLRAAQASAVRALARAVLDGTMRFDAAGGVEDLVAAMTALPGIGEWTAQYVAMRAGGEPDAFPAADLALRKAAGGITARALERRAQAWRPWRSYAAMHLWRSSTQGGSE